MTPVDERIPNLCSGSVVRSTSLAEQTEVDGLIPVSSDPVESRIFMLDTHVEPVTPAEKPSEALEELSLSEKSQQKPLPENGANLGLSAPAGIVNVEPVTTQMWLPLLSF